MASTEKLPSVFLPPLQPPPPPSLLSPLLVRLSSIYTPANVIIDLTTPTLAIKTVRGPEHDEFEASFARGWLGRVVSLGSRQIGRGEDDWESVVNAAAGILADLSGHCAAGSSTRTFLLPKPTPRPPPVVGSLNPPPDTPSAATSAADSALVLSIRDTTLLASSTGFRTWGSAPLLSRLIAVDPFTFVEPSPAPLRILELGSGTGLVGLTIAAALASVGQPATVELTDFEAPVLDNLQHNVASNKLALGSTSVKISRLDWTDFFDGRLTHDSTGEFDYILGADLVYEPEHLNWLHATVSSLLRFPSSSFPSPTFHLVLPLRSTHAKEHYGFDAAFSVAGDGVEGRWRCDAHGVRWRLTTLQRTDATGEDGFGGARERAAEGSESKVGRYWVYRIGWRKVE